MNVTEAVAQREQALAVYRSACPVYFIQYGAAGLIKIGNSSNVRKRMATIQANCPLPLRLLGWRLGGITEETRLHKVFAAARAWGEWFQPVPELLEYVALHTSQAEPPLSVFPQDAVDAVHNAARAERALKVA